MTTQPLESFRMKVARNQRARELVDHVMQKLSAPRRGHDGPKLPDVPDAPSVDPVKPPTPPKAFNTKPVKFNPQTRSGAVQGTLKQTT